VRVCCDDDFRDLCSCAHDSSCLPLRSIRKADHEGNTRCWAGVGAVSPRTGINRVLHAFPLAAGFHLKLLYRKPSTIFDMRRFDPSDQRVTPSGTGLPSFQRPQKPQLPFDVSRSWLARTVTIKTATSLLRIDACFEVVGCARMQG
jgi:hypothetical protein